MEKNEKYWCGDDELLCAAYADACNSGDNFETRRIYKLLRKKIYKIVYYQFHTENHHDRITCMNHLFLVIPQIKKDPEKKYYSYLNRTAANYYNHPYSKKIKGRGKEKGVETNINDDEIFFNSSHSYSINENLITIEREIEERLNHIRQKIILKYKDDQQKFKLYNNFLEKCLEFQEKYDGNYRQMVTYAAIELNVYKSRNVAVISNFLFGRGIYFDLKKYEEDDKK